MTDDVWAGFGEATRTWFDAAFAEPTPAQVGSLARDRAPAATRSSWRPPGPARRSARSCGRWTGWPRRRRRPTKERCRVLYISPLKALAVDVERNLRAPLTGIRHTATRLGLPEPDIRVGTRSGDTPANERRGLVSKPPDILITTPESLFLMLTSQAREIAAQRRHRDRRRGPRRGRHQARGPPRPLAGAPGRAPPPARPADRPLRHGAPPRRGRPLPRRQPPGRDRRSPRREAVGPQRRRARRGHVRARRPGRRPGGPGRRRGAPHLHLALHRGAGRRPRRAAPLHHRLRQLPPPRRAPHRPPQRDRHRPSGRSGRRSIAEGPEGSDVQPPAPLSVATRGPDPSTAAGDPSAPSASPVTSRGNEGEPSGEAAVGGGSTVDGTGPRATEERGWLGDPPPSGASPASRPPAQVMAQSGAVRGRRGGHRPRPPRLGLQGPARAHRGRPQARPAALRGGHVQPRARHRHGRRRPRRADRVAAQRGLGAAAGRSCRPPGRRGVPRGAAAQAPRRPRRTPRSRSRACAPVASSRCGCRPTRWTCWPSRSWP